MKNAPAFIVFLALAFAGLTIYQSANAAPTSDQKQPQSQSEALATPSLQAVVTQHAENIPATPDYIATKTGLENSALALGLTITADAATSVANQEATKQAEIHYESTKQSKIKQDEIDRKTEEDLLKLEELRRLSEDRINMSKFWEWLKFSAAGLGIFAAFTAFRYFVPVMAARMTPPDYHQLVAVHAPQQAEPSEPITVERTFRFLLQREGETSIKRGQFPHELLEPIYRLAQAVAKGAQFSEDDLCGNGKAFQSRNALFEKTKEFFLVNEMLEEVRDEDGKLRYYYMTRDMRKYLAQYAEQYEQFTQEQA